MGRKKKEDSLPDEAKAPEAPKPWAITQADIDATTDVEVAFATTRCLPPADIIPKPFWDSYYEKGVNIYVLMADALFCGSEMPQGTVEFNEGFREDPVALQRFIMAHLRSFEPKHEHKIAGLAYMISQITTITPDKE